MKYVNAGQTPDAAELGLDSKFELEAVNEFLLKSCDLVLLKVGKMESCKNCARTVYMIVMEACVNSN